MLPSIKQSISNMFRNFKRPMTCYETWNMNEYSRFASDLSMLQYFFKHRRKLLHLKPLCETFLTSETLCFGMNLSFSSQNWATHTGNCELETFIGEVQRQTTSTCNLTVTACKQKLYILLLRTFWLQALNNVV